MNKTSKEQRLFRLDVIGKHIEKYRVMMSIILGVFILAITGLIIYWNYDENNINNAVDNTYLITDVIIAAISLCLYIVFYFNKKGKINSVLLAIIFHVYAFILMAWATAAAILDLEIGITPFIYLIAATVVSSLFVLQPYFFTLVSLGSFLSILIFHIIRKYPFFSGDYGVEHLIYFIIFSVIIIVISFRHFNVTIREYRAIKKVEQMTYYDELTSLLNERSYIVKTEEINNNIKNGNVKPFAVVLMDVNNLKNTNDKYGHRYGCSLIVRTGHTLGDVFKTSSLYHIGGDEFIAIVEGEDYDNFDNLIELFDKTFRYSLVEYEGVELIFSVAR